MSKEPITRGSCGTKSGYTLHKRNHEEACRPCKAAYREFMQDYRASRPEYRKASSRRAATRARAMERLAKMYPEEFRALLAEETRKGKGKRDG